MNELFLDLVFDYLLPIPAILIAMTVHEVCHGFVAYKCGDPTAAATGRLSFNPLRHIDPLGFLSLMLIGFGAARPVQVNPRNLRHPRRDMAFVALAGPMSNLLMAFFGAMLLSAYLNFLEPFLAAGASFSQGLSLVLYYLLAYFVSINLGFFAFNLIPLPPLDGSHIVLSMLPSKIYWKVRRYDRIFSYVFLGLIVLSLVARRVPALAQLDLISLLLGPVHSFFYNAFYSFWDFIFGGLL